MNSSTASSGTATSCTASANTSTDSVKSSGAPAATNKVCVKSILFVSFSVKTAFAATSAVKSSEPSAKFS